MFNLAKEVLKEILIFLVMGQVVYFLIPKPLKKIIRGLTKCLSRVVKGITRYANTHINYLKQRKKVTPVQVEQPHENIIKVIYPNRRVKKYYKAN